MKIKKPTKVLNKIKGMYKQQIHVENEDKMQDELEYEVDDDMEEIER